MSIVSIAITPLTGRLIVGNKQQYQAIATNDDASTEDITSTATWSSSDPTIASIQSLTGLALAVAVGSVTITAGKGGVYGTATLYIDSANNEKQIVSFAGLQGQYRTGEYKTKRYKFLPTAFSVVKVIASDYPVRLDIIYPSLPKSISVTVTSSKPKRIYPFLVDTCEVRIFVEGQITAVYLASSIGELPV